MIDEILVDAGASDTVSRLRPGCPGPRWRTPTCPARTEGIDWRSIDVAGVRLDLTQAMAFAAAHGIRLD